MIVAYGLDLLGTLPGGEIATRGLLYAWLFIAIPAGVSLAVNLLVGAVAAPVGRTVARPAAAGGGGDAGRAEVKRRRGNSTAIARPASPRC